MGIVLQVLIGIIALFHIYILWMEMFAWTTRAPKVFTNFPKELFPQTKALAANQGLYNGFLAAGLIWTFFICNPMWKANVSLFFLICVAVAGIYGALTASKKIFFVQALPALIAIGLLVIAPKKCETVCYAEKNVKTVFYTFENGDSGDTMKYDKLPLHLKDDSLIYTRRFEFKNTEYVMDFYLAKKKIPDVSFECEIRGLGRIYSEGEQHRFFYSTNDSIHEIIDSGIRELLKNKEDIDYFCSIFLPEESRTIPFAPPVFYK